ncbi:MAG: DNA repair protein RecO [Candidatus Omnitrophota bacterium]
MSIQKSEAILLSKRDIRETSSMVFFFTRDFGKIKSLIKGVRGPQAKFGQYLREFAKYDIVYYEKQKAAAYLTTQCDLKDAYTEIAEDLDKRISAYYILELVDKFTSQDDKSPEIYELLLWILEFIRKEKFITRAVIMFQLKLLEYAGFLPVLEACCDCSREVSSSAYFSVRMGGLLCASCRGADIQATPLSKGAISSVNLIRKNSLSQLSRLTMTNDINKELKRLLEGFITYHIGDHLKTGEFMRQMSVV